jgi:uncharacterized protein YggE
MEREIVVRGRGEARALPDLASLRVEVAADHKSQDEAHEARAKQAAKVDVVLAEHRDADIRTGWRASRTSFVEIAVLDELSDIMSGIVEAGGAVHGPQWSMAPTNPAYDQARRAAAEDARHRALSYAQALDLVLGPVAWVAEPGMRLAGGTPGPPLPGAPMTRAATAGNLSTESAEPTEDLTPSEMTVDVVVEVGFGII